MKAQFVYYMHALFADRKLSLDNMIVTDNSFSYTFESRFSMLRGKKETRIYEYEAELSNHLQPIHPNLFVYSEHYIDGFDQLEGKRYHCVIYQEDKRIFTTHVFTRSRYKIEAHWSVFTDVCSFSEDFKARLYDSTIDPSYVIQIEKELKQAVLQLPEYRLLHVTGLIR